MANLAKMFDSPVDKEVTDGDIFVFTFLQPTKSRKITYRQQQELLRISLEENSDFNKEGMILDTIEKGVSYPVIHVLRIGTNQTATTTINLLKPLRLNVERPLLSFTKSEQVQFDQGCDKSRQVQVASIKINKSTDLGPDVYLIQGVFREKRRIEPEYACTPRDNLENRAFILVGVNMVDHGYAYGLERSWRDLTGARTIYHHLHNEHDLCRILFLERTNKCSDVSLFAYLVLVECRCVTSKNRQRILDFVQRMRVERINTYISIYHDVDSVSPARIGASVTVNSISTGGYETKMEWGGKQLQMPLLRPPQNDSEQFEHKSVLRHR